MENPLDRHIKAYQGNNLYDFDNHIILNWYPKRIEKYAGDANSLLELGLGHGITTDFFSKRFERYLVLDASPAVIERFREEFPDCTADINEIYFEKFSSDERFDIIVAGFVLEHVDDPMEILCHFKQFLSEKGRMFVTVPNAEVLNRRLGHLAGMLPDIEALSEHDHLCGHKRYYTVDSLSGQVHEAGYDIVRMEGIYLKPITTQQMLTLDFDPGIIEALCLVGIDYPELSCALFAELKAAS
jgi:trans-aconitate methyltransferase